jgi:hypothetical protein
MTAVAQEVRGIDGGGGNRWSKERQGLRERRGLRKFWVEKQNDMGRATIYMFENILSSFGLKPLLIVLESGPKRFWFQTATDEGIISNSSKLEPLLIS